MGIGAGYCEGNLNFATASEDDEVYTKKKVSRVSLFCTIFERHVRSIDTFSSFVSTIRLYLRLFISIPIAYYF